MTESLLEVRDLEKHFYERDTLVDRALGGEPVSIQAVDGVSFDVREGETLGLVGESGCGKSTCGETLLRLQDPTGGTVRFDGEDVLDLSGDDLRSFRRNAQVVFQDPFSSLDPRMTVGATVRQPLDVHSVGTKAERTERVCELLERVGLSSDQYDRYPHEFSGGQRQRIGIARALALEPDFIVLDEPTSALDVSVQAQILNLLSDLQDEFDLTYLLISHDLSVIRHISDRVAVMYLGELVEVGPVADIFESPKHPYTQALLESVPRASTDERDREIETLSGDVPSPRNPPSGCRFRTRCPSVIPPEDVTIDQREYRQIMDVRERIESREVDLDSAWEYVADEQPSSGGSSLRSLLGDDVREDPFRERHAEAFVDRLEERMLDVELSGSHAQTVRSALHELCYEDWEGAASILAEEYESVCEVVSPALQDDRTHPVACHLYDQPDSVTANVADADVSAPVGDTVRTDGAESD
ncbi:ABC transporter ATP-binding protein [Salinarchaeum laminariae]|uniref:ABC transporter ATP-binding protein n=1 Tax=Salinarchaeum laminariae TaxID=869888 RepID=UPI0020BEE04F|nr:ABC transporter ATP-binding protein [Salinarchaeum laminariae]